MEVVYLLRSTSAPPPGEELMKLGEEDEQGVEL